MSIKSSVLIAMLLAVLLVGCDSGVTRHEPGVYKGPEDTTATPEAAAQRSEALRKRATTAFTDR